MNAGPGTISKVFLSNSLLRIPYFQRPYVWDEEDWKRFAEDMESTIESATGNRRKYFLGALIFKEEEPTQNEVLEGIDSKQLVIDGQQRLTTMAIYMKILHILAGRENKFNNQFLQDNPSKDPVIIHSCDDAPQFRVIMHLPTLRDVEGDSNIVRAYMFFKNYLRERQQNGVNMTHLLNTVISSINFVIISLQKDDDEQQIFDTINSLGEPLTTGDLLKNFLYRDNDELLYKDTWYKVFDTKDNFKFWNEHISKTSQAKTAENKRIEKFLYAYVRMKMWDFQEHFRGNDRKDFVKTKNVFYTVKTFVNIFGADRIEIANEIVEYAKLYRKHLSSDILDIRVPQHFGIKRISCLLNATKKETPIPYILYILKNVQDETERNLIFGYIETYIIRRMLAESSNDDKSYSEFFTEQLIGQKINTFNKLKAYNQKQSDNNLAMPTDSRIKMRQSEKKLDEIRARIIYYLYETKLVPTSANTFNKGFNSYYAEQLMPKPGKEADPNWPVLPNQDEENERVKLLGTLGNYFLLDDIDTKELKKVHNIALTLKKETILRWTQGIRSSHIPLKQINNWDSSEIRKRNNGYAEKFCKDIWPINNND